MAELTVQVIHSIPLHLGKIEAIEIGVGADFKGCEWRYLDDKVLLIHQSNNQYGNPIAALRDGLVTVIGLPNDSTMREVEQVREIITSYFQ